MVKTIGCLGDSQTQLTPYYAVRPEQMWAERLAAILRATGADVRARAYGIGGQSTGQMMNRADILSQWEVPDLAVLYGGVNDTLTGTIPTAAAGTSGSIAVSGGAPWYGVGFLVVYTTGGVMAPVLQAVQLTAGATGSITLTGASANSSVASIEVYVSPIGYASAALAMADNRALRLQTTLESAASGAVTTLSSVSAQMPTAGTQATTAGWCKAMRFGVTGEAPGTSRQTWVRSQPDLSANARTGQRTIVLDDTSATGGLAAVLIGQKERIAGDYSAVPQQSVWECRTPQSGEAGWGRVAIASTPTFAGCCSRLVVVSTNYLNWSSGGDIAGAPSAVNAAIRAQSLAAATAEGAAYCDLWAFQSGLIVSGETTQGSNSWHAITNNQHHNAYGHDTVARAVYATIAAQQGWLAAIK